MRPFDYSTLPPELLTVEIMNLVSAIHEYRGKQEIFVEAKPGMLEALLDRAVEQSVGASNRIEGIRISDERLEALVDKRAEPRNEPEREIAGYREVLAQIQENYSHIVPQPGVILQMHRDLYQYSHPSSFMGDETPGSVEELTAALLDSLLRERIDPLLLIPVFALDFLCLRPFHDGNGRMSRLLTLLLLHRSGYGVGRYVSLEAIIERTQDEYYGALQASSAGWHEERHSCLPFVRYMLEVVLTAYRDFTCRVEHLLARGVSKPERIRKLFDGTFRLSKTDIVERYPDIGITAVEVALSALLREGYIVKVGAGKSASYIRNLN